MFITLFLDEAKKYNLENKIETKGQKVELSFISDYEAESVDLLTKEEIKSDFKIDTKNEVVMIFLFAITFRASILKTDQ